MKADTRWAAMAAAALVALGCQPARTSVPASPATTNAVETPPVPPPSVPTVASSAPRPEPTCGAFAPCVGQDTCAVAIPGPDLIAFFAHDNLVLWSPSSNSTRRYVDPDGEVITSLHLPPRLDGPALLTADASGSATLWDASNAAPKKRIDGAGSACEPRFEPWATASDGTASPYGCPLNGSGVAWSHTGERLVVSAGSELLLLTGEGRLIRSFAAPRDPYGALSPDGRFVALRREDGQLDLVQADTWRVVLSRSGVAGFRWAPDGLGLVVYEHDEHHRPLRTSVLRRREGESSFRERWSASCAAFSEWSPDGKVLLGLAGPGCGRRRQQFVLVDAETGAERGRWDKPFTTCSQAAWSPGGHAYVDGEEAIRLFDGKSVRVLESLAPENDEGCMLWWQPDGKRFATAYRFWSQQGPVGEWEKRAEDGIMASAGPVARWSEDGKVFGLLQDGRFVTWSVPDGRRLAGYEEVADARWLADGTLALVARSPSGTLKLVDAEGSRTLAVQATCEGVSVVEL